MSAERRTYTTKVKELRCKEAFVVTNEQMKEAMESPEGWAALLENAYVFVTWGIEVPESKCAAAIVEIDETIKGCTDRGGNCESESELYNISSVFTNELMVTGMPDGRYLFVRKEPVEVDITYYKYE